MSVVNRFVRGHCNPECMSSRNEYTRLYARIPSQPAAIGVHGNSALIRTTLKKILGREKPSFVHRKLLSHLDLQLRSALWTVEKIRSGSSDFEK